MTANQYIWDSNIMKYTEMNCCYYRMENSVELRIIKKIREENKKSLRSNANSGCVMIT